MKNHLIYWFFENSVKKVVFVKYCGFFFKIRGNEWFVTTFSSFIKKTDKVVFFHLNMAIFGALNRIFTLNLEVTSELARRSKKGHIAGGQDVTSRT